MSSLFLKIVNMSITASWLILAVILLRGILKKAPKWINVLLWGIVAIRLICPFSFESTLSLIPSTETISPEIMMDWTPEISTGVSSIDKVVNPLITEAFAPEPIASANPLQILIPILANIWLLGIVSMCLYAIISYIRLRKKVGASIQFQNNIWLCDDIQTPFILGCFKPRIYIPSGTDEAQLSHIIAHENAHLKRRDHWWKPFGFIVLSIHWLNPLVWVAYILLCRDIELACDEKVIRELNQSESIAYSEALLSCSVNRRMVMVCPLAFGEVGVKERVNRVLNYKKPTFWIITVSVIASVILAICFLTNPATSVDEQLAVFVDCEIASHHQSQYSGENFCCLDWEVIGKDTNGNQTTLYMWVLYEEYRNDNGLNVEAGAHTPTVITVEKNKGSYNLVEYWEPRNGSYYAEDIKDKFPVYLWSKALDSQRYIDSQSAKLEQLAIKHFENSELTTSNDSIDSGAVIPMVMVNDTLYLDTGYESTVDGRCGVMDGEITSSVHGNSKPTINNQSNFGEGYGYQYGTIEGTIEIYIDEQWRIFATKEVRASGEFMTASSNETITYNGKEYKKSELCDATLQWLELSETDRLLSSYFPPEFMIFDEKWGISLTAEDITPTSVTIKCTQAAGEPTGNLQTGSWFILQTWTQENGWKEIPHIIEGNISWTQEA